MDRREAIKRTSLMMGMAVSSSVVTGLMQGCSTPLREVGWTPSFLSVEQARLVGDIAERIIPKTDTPGALDQGVDAFIDMIVKECFDSKEQTMFQEGLTEFESKCDEITGKSFAACTTKEQDKVLGEIEDKQLSAFKENPDPSKKPIYLQIRELTLLNYFTSETVMTSQFIYEPIPTKLEGCIPMEKGQKAKVGNAF
ncbi:MAG: gluconate 2-dehydrogenase subunit 3 family protein [Bacteroidota bacterium]